MQWEEWIDDAQSKTRFNLHVDLQLCQPIERIMAVAKARLQVQGYLCGISPCMSLPLKRSLVASNCGTKHHLHYLHWLQIWPQGDSNGVI